MNAKRFFGIVFALFLFFFIVQNPVESANFATNVWNGLVHVFNQPAIFMRDLG